MDGMKQRCCWSHIQDDVFGLILERLCLTDYLRICAVCSSWRAIVVKAIANRHCPPTPQLPHLLLLLPTDKKVDFLNLTTRRLSYSMKLPSEATPSCHGSIEGWMIMSEIGSVPNSRVIVFLNPVTTATVKLPSLLKNPSKSPTRYRIRKIVASSIPSNPDCLVVVLFDDFIHLAFSKVSGKSWTVIEGDKDAGICFVEMEILDRKLYVLSDHNAFCSVLIYDLQESLASDPPKPKIRVSLPQIRPATTLITLDDLSYLSNGLIKYLAIDAESQEILVIYMVYYAVFKLENVGYMNTVTSYVIPPQTTAFKVLKLEMCREPPLGVEIGSLENRLLLVGYLKSLVISTTALNGPEELIRENSIYFAKASTCSPQPWRGTQIGKFCLTDRNFLYFVLTRPSSRGTPSLCWFIPNVW